MNSCPNRQLNQLERLNGIQWLWLQSSPFSIVTSKESVSGQYHIYHFIPLHSYDYLKKTSMKINLVNNKGNIPNKIWHWTKDEIGVAVGSWLWVRFERYQAHSVVGWASECNSVVVGSNPTQTNFLQLFQKNLSMVNTICISSFRYTHVITSRKLWLK